MHTRRSPLSTAPLLLSVLASLFDPGDLLAQRLSSDSVQSFERFVEVYQGWVQQVAANHPCTDSIAPVGNELHDCQRLVVFEESRPAFGPLVGIYPVLGTIGSVTDYTRPQLVALVVNYGADVVYQGQSVLYASDAYAQLGIDPGSSLSPTMHCLWLRDTGRRWEAAMVPPPPTQQECNQSRPPRQWDLDVRRETYQNALFDAYPNTARWMWTRPHVLNSRETHFIGIKCGDGWCQVGAPGFNPFGVPQPTPQWAPARAIPGFSDGQFLAVMKEGWAPGTGTGSPFEPGPWGEVHPLRVPHGWQWTRPFEVAAIEVDPASRGLDEYDRKLGLGQRGGLRTSRLIMEGPSGGNPAGVGAYLNRVSGTMAMARAVHASRIPHGVSGSSRWRWHDDTDETVWASCWRGCCEAEEAN